MGICMYPSCSDSGPSRCFSFMSTNDLLHDMIVYDASFLLRERLHLTHHIYRTSSSPEVKAELSFCLSLSPINSGIRNCITTVRTHLGKATLTCYCFSSVFGGVLLRKTRYTLARVLIDKYAIRPAIVQCKRVSNCFIRAYDN